jgi:hypothetical protein
MNECAFFKSAFFVFIAFLPPADVCCVNLKFPISSLAFFITSP